MPISHLALSYQFATLLRTAVEFDIMSWFYYSEELSAFRFYVSFARVTQNELIIAVFFMCFIFGTVEMISTSLAVGELR